MITDASNVSLRKMKNATMLNTSWNDAILVHSTAVKHDLSLVNKPYSGCNSKKYSFVAIWCSPSRRNADEACRARYYGLDWQAYSVTATRQHRII